MSEFLEKTCFGLVAIAVSIIAVELLPISIQSSYWNKCFHKTNAWLAKSIKLEKLKDSDRQALSVAVCNGAVYEPQIVND